MRQAPERITLAHRCKTSAYDQEEVSPFTVINFLLPLHKSKVIFDSYGVNGFHEMFAAAFGW